MNQLNGFLINKYMRSAVLLGVVFTLAACRSGSSSSDNEVVPETKQVTLRLLPNISTTSIDDHVLDTNGYAHFFETQDYQVAVEGEVVKSGIELDFENPVELKLEVANRDEVEIMVLHTRLDEDKSAGAVFTAVLDGDTMLTQESSHADIVLENNGYSFVTVDMNEALYINEARLNDIAMRRIDTEEQSFSYKYGYTPSEHSILAMESDLGVQVATFSSNQAKQYKFIVDENSNELVLDDNEDEIDLGGKVAINPNRIKNAVNVTVSETGAVHGSSKGIKGEAVQIIYPMRTLSGDLRKVSPLHRYDIDFDIDVTYTGAQSYVNIYLEKEGKNCRADYHLTGASAGLVIVDNCDGYETFDSYRSFVDQYGAWGVRNNYREFGLANFEPVNFIYRLGDSHSDYLTEFAVNEYEINVLPAVIDYNQILGAKEVTTENNGSVSGKTKGEAPVVYVPVENKLTLAHYDLSIDIDFEAAQHFVNIYLKDESGNNVRADYYLSGSLAGKVSIEGNHLSLEEFMSSEKYSRYEVRNDYIEWYGLKPFNGNFIWRGGDSGYDGEDDPFTINEYRVK